MNWTEWNERIGSKLVDRAFLIARRDGIEPGTALAIEALIRQARAELSREAGIDPYESVTMEEGKTAAQIEGVNFSHSYDRVLRLKDLNGNAVGEMEVTR